VAEPGQRRTLAAILSADVAGYSRLIQDDDAATVDTLTKYRTIFSDFVSRHDGHVVDSPGDNILAQFDSPVEAVQCAVEIQSKLGRRNLQLAEHRQMHFRIGINLGDILSRDDGTIYGDGVNIAARLEALAEPGGITVSGTLFDHVEDKLPISFEFDGEQSVKNIAKPVRVYRVGLNASASPEFPIPPANTTRNAQRKKWAVVGGLALVIVIGVVTWKTSRVDQGDLYMGDPVVAVLAFANVSRDPKQEYFSDGLAETVINSLAHVRELKVVARNSSFRYKGKAVDARKVGEELGADYIVEGSVRRSAGTVRVTAQLIESKRGVHLWSNSYERELTVENVFAIQDDIAAAIVGNIAGYYGVLNKSALEATKRKPPQDLNSYDCVLLHSAYLEALSLEAFRATRDCAEEAIKIEPDYAPLWVVLANIARAEFQYGYDPRPGSLDRSLEAGHRALRLDPGAAGLHSGLAITHFFRGELDEFKLETERELALAPNSTSTTGTLGLYMVYAGEWEKGLAIIERAKELNPFYPWWYNNGEFHNFYRNKDYAKAVNVARKLNLTDFVQAQSQLVAAYGQLGQSSDARPIIDRIHELDPTFDARRHWESRFRYQPKYLEHLLDGLRKAGLDISDAPTSTN
jgi:adenylate cyclase